MKHKNILRIFGAAVILTLLIAVLPVAPVLAAGSLTFNPTQGKVGDTINFTGSGWNTIIDDTPWAVDLYISDQQAVLNNDIDTNVTRYRLLNTFELLVNGTISGSFIIPTTLNQGTLGTATPLTVTAGVYYIYASNRYDIGETPSKNINAVQSFTVSPGAIIALSPTTGSVGTSVRITGTNFPASATISVKIDNTVVPIDSEDLVTQITGAFLSYIKIPAGLTVGAHTITVTAGTSTSSPATFTVTANPAIETILPESGPAGTQVTITGTSFPANTQLAFKFDETAVTVTGGSAQTGSGGSFASIITVPSDAIAGSHLITVTAGTSTVTKTFTVTAPATTTTTPPPTSTTTTPPASTTTTPTPPPSATTITLNKSGNFVGASIGIGGSGFKTNGTVTLKYDDKTVGTATADASGFFVATFLVPASKFGSHTITATDGTNSNTATFELESTPPKTPKPLSPGMGENIKSPLTFDWEDVTDESGPVTYKFQIATSSNFAANTIVIDKSGINKSEYTLTEVEELRLASDENLYYWREKSVDAAQNESDWTGAGEFSVSQPFKFSGWPMIVIIIVGAVVMWLFGFWIGRKTAFYY